MLYGLFRKGVIITIFPVDSSCLRHITAAWRITAERMLCAIT